MRFIWFKIKPVFYTTEQYVSLIHYTHALVDESYTEVYFYVGNDTIYSNFLSKQIFKQSTNLFSITLNFIENSCLTKTTFIYEV